jgi:hypothetical protein
MKPSLDHHIKTVHKGEGPDASSIKNKKEEHEVTDFITTI